MSSSRLFADIVGAMVVDCGFTPAYSATMEFASVAMTRTDPCILISDCDAGLERMRRLIKEVLARRIPLLLARPRREYPVEQALTLGHRAAWFSFPIAQNAFCTMLDALLPPVLHTVAPSGDTAAGDNERADDDGMALLGPGPAEHPSIELIRGTSPVHTATG